MQSLEVKRSFIFIHFMPLVSFYTPWKHEKVFGFLMFSGVIKVITGIKWANVLRAYFWKKWNACDFSEKGQKKGQNKTKYLKIWAKMYKIWKYFEKGQPHVCDYRMHETARICPGAINLGIQEQFLMKAMDFQVKGEKVFLFLWP